MRSNSSSSIQINDLVFCEELSDAKIIGAGTPPKTISDGKAYREGMEVQRQAEVKDAKWLYSGSSPIPSFLGIEDEFYVNAGHRLGTPDEAISDAKKIEFEVGNANDIF